jgi:hypothetical protein
MTRAENVLRHKNKKFKERKVEGNVQIHLVERKKYKILRKKST